MCICKLYGKGISAGTNERIKECSTINQSLLENVLFINSFIFIIKKEALSRVMWNYVALHGKHIDKNCTDNIHNFAPPGGTLGRSKQTTRLNSLQLNI